MSSQQAYNNGPYRPTSGTTFKSRFAGGGGGADRTGILTISGFIFIIVATRTNARVYVCVGGWGGYRIFGKFEIYAIYMRRIAFQQMKNVKCWHRLICSFTKNQFSHDMAP